MAESGLIPRMHIEDGLAAAQSLSNSLTLIFPSQRGTDRGTARSLESIVITSTHRSVDGDTMTSGRTGAHDVNTTVSLSHRSRNSNDVMAPGISSRPGTYRGSARGGGGTGNNTDRSHTTANTRNSPVPFPMLYSASLLSTSSYVATSNNQSNSRGRERDSNNSTPLLPEVPPSAALSTVQMESLFVQLTYSYLPLILALVGRVCYNCHVMYRGVVHT